MCECVRLPANSFSLIIDPVAGMPAEIRAGIQVADPLTA
jgi:hypothetical protein